MKHSRSSNFIRQITICLFLLGFSFGAQAIELSDSSRISLLTCSRGEELYTAFGHTGIRVTDYRQNLDIVFNYGTFDFNQPGFYLNFIRGKMRYMLSVDDFRDFMMEYVHDQRSVQEQELNLKTEDKKKVFAFLYNNSLVQNREYFYDFFWDNCATRQRDVFEKVLPGRIKYHTDSCGFQKNKTLHDMLRIYVHDMPWVDFGFDLSLGLPCEIIANDRAQTFLPDYLAKYFACATLDGQPLVGKTAYLIQFPPVKNEVTIKPIHLTILLLLIAIGVSLYEIRKRKHYYGFDFTVFFIAGLLGTILLSMWLFTSHYSTPKNMNMCWLIPVHIIVSFFLLKRQKPRWLFYYFLATSILMLLLLLTWPWNPQPLNYAFAPLIVLLGLRSFLIYYNPLKP